MAEKVRVVFDVAALEKAAVEPADAEGQLRVALMKIDRLKTVFAMLRNVADGILAEACANDEGLDTDRLFEWLELAGAMVSEIDES